MIQDVYGDGQPARKKVTAILTVLGANFSPLPG